MKLYKVIRAQGVIFLGHTVHLRCLALMLHHNTTATLYPTAPHELGEIFNKKLLFKLFVWYTINF